MAWSQVVVSRQVVRTSFWAKRGHEVVGRWLNGIGFHFRCFWHQHGGLWGGGRNWRWRPARWLGQVLKTWTRAEEWTEREAQLLTSPERKGLHAHFPCLLHSVKKEEFCQTNYRGSRLRGHLKSPRLLNWGCPNRNLWPKPAIIPQNCRTELTQQSFLSICVREIPVCSPSLFLTS